MYIFVSLSLWESLAFAFFLSFFFSAFVHTHLYYVACSPGGQLVLFLAVVLRHIKHHHISYFSSLYLLFLLISLLQPCFLLLISTAIISLTFPLSQGLASYLISWFSGVSFFFLFVLGDCGILVLVVWYLLLGFYYIYFCERFGI